MEHDADLVDRRRFRGVRCACMALALLAGCSRDESDRLAPVTGTVKVNGKRVTVGSVSFRPDAAKGNNSQHHPTGNIDANGNYELFTVGKKGAPPGWYRVLVFADANALSQQEIVHPLPPKWLVNVKYTSEETTDLYVEVVEVSPAKVYDLDLSK